MKKTKFSEAFSILAKGANFNDEEMIVCGIVGSTNDKDRSNDVIEQSGWELENFKKNPVILYGHDYEELPVGKAINVEIKQGKLTFDVAFAHHTFAKEVYQLLKEGFLNAFSVGFKALEYNWDEQLKGYHIEKAELYELSVVPVPANQEAVLSRVKSAYQKGLCDDYRDEKQEEDKDKISLDKVAKMVRAEVAKQLAESQNLSAESDGQNAPKPTLNNALDVLLTQAKDVNRASGKFLRAINKLNQKGSQ